jgi:hypothetical protein
MKPKKIQTTPQRHYCLIVTALACDEAIEAGIINKDNVTPLLFFFIKAWKNEQIHRWLTNRDKSVLRESRLIGLIRFLYEKGSVFEYDCKRSTIANLLLEMDAFSTISSYKTVMNYFNRNMPAMVASQAERIFAETFIP